MGLGGWLTNFKRYTVVPSDKRFVLTVGDEEHFESYITREDIAYITSLGVDHIRLAFDQFVMEPTIGTYRQAIFEDENVVYTFHFYDPIEFTHQRGVLQELDAPYCV